MLGRLLQYLTLHGNLSCATECKEAYRRQICVPDRSTINGNWAHRVGPVGYLRPSGLIRIGITVLIRGAFGAIKLAD